MYNTPMSKVYISARANRALIEYLAQYGHTVCMLPPLPQLEKAIADHPDLVFCSLNPAAGGPVFHGKISAVQPCYPSDVPYNACCTGRYFIHNLKYTAPELRSAAETLGMTLIDVPQGYTRCSCLPVDENSIITADMGIVKACRAAGLDVLEVTTGHVDLPGYPYGFIGGCGGRVGNTIVFHGNLDSGTGGHPDGAAIRRFIEERGLTLVDFPQFKLTDIGSIIEENDL